ncbi:hypothetical protein HC229_13695 [Flavobacterium sp. D33]|nr:hypothetical protein [Flavobacterium selenitireducens]
MDPVDHVLTPSEKVKVDNAFAMLPLLHQKILKRHLHSISFMDNMPNTALTSPVETTGAVKKFNITFRAEILDETISEWATWKEKTCYDFAANKEYQLLIDAGTLDAILYVLLHEATHVVDVVRDLTPHPDDADALVAPTAFTSNVWEKMNVPVPGFIKPLLEKTRFRGGQLIDIARAPEVYATLEQTPFVSLYGTASWSEDLAELVTIYHLTAKLGQPFRILMLKNGVELYRFEPMKNQLVKRRVDQLDSFYK